MLTTKQNTFVVSIILLWLTLSSLCWAGAPTLQFSITGVNGAILQNIQERLAIMQSSYGTELTPETVAVAYKNAPQTIRQAIQPFGYFDPTLHSALTHASNHWTAHVAIVLGTPVRIATTNLQITGPGHLNAALLALIPTLSLKAGTVFAATDYDKAKQALFQTANDEGFLKATFDEKVIRIDLKTHTAVIILHLNTGPRYYFGAVTFNQNTFSDAFLARFLGFRSGEPFSSPKLLKLQQDLSNSNYFQTINVAPNLKNLTQRTVSVIIDLTANKSQQYNVGLGYGTFTGPRLTLGANLRHLTRTGHHVDAQVKVSKVLSGLAVQYVIPGQNPLTDQYTIGANAQKFSPKNGNSISKSISFSYVKTINDWKTTLAATYLREHYNVTNNPSHNSRILYPSVEVLRVKADDLIYTRYGTKLDVLMRGASQHVVSSESFIQAEVKAKWIYSPTKWSRMILRTDVGYTVVRDLNTLPISLQFYAGGLDSIRGFGFSYFGPGRYLKIASAEVQHRLVGNFDGAVFFDIGTADNHINAPMGRGVGIGLIYRSGIGPIKAYAGFGYLAQKPRHFAFEFSLGPDL